MSKKRLQIRERPNAPGESIRSLSFQARSESANDEDRSIEGVISTEAPVQIYDWYRGEVVDEVLLNSGAQIPEQMPLLANHQRWSLDCVLGSARNIRAEDGGDGRPGVLSARMHFVKGDDEVEKVWNKARQGHLRDLSVGYLVESSVDIAAGQTATVAGRKFTAGKNALRVATKWHLKEVSLTPIGADAGAKTRSYQGVLRMPPELRRYLVSLGLRADASDTEAITFCQSLTGEQRTQADALSGQARSATPSAATATRSKPKRRKAAAKPRRRADEVMDEEDDEEDTDVVLDEEAGDEEDAGRALSRERVRIREIHELGGEDVPREMVRRAVEEGWTLQRASTEFLGAIRGARHAPAAGSGGGPAIHSRSHEVDCNVRSLAAGFALSQNLDPTRVRMHTGRGTPTSRDLLTARDAELGQDLSRLSAVDLVRECARIDTGRYYRDPAEAIRAAVSGATFSHVFSTNVYARLLAGWDRFADSTLGWTDEEDVANFLQQEDITLTANARLEQLPRGDEAKHATASDTHETYKIVRYAKQFVADEQDILDDRLGAIMRMPEEMGEAARRMRPDLVYSIMLENPALVADSGAVFNATAVTTAGGHANLITGGLSDANLKLAISAMGKQRVNNDVLNITPTHLIVPAALDWTAQALTTTASLAKLFADSSDPIYTTENLIARKRLVPVMDDRIGLSGVFDPRTKAVRAGTDTNWFLVAKSPRGLRVAYRRGTNRQPQMRSFTLDQGRWGIGWDINLDIGAAFMDYRYVNKSTGAG